MILPLTFLGGVFYSVDRLGSPWEQISHANPLFYVVDAVRYGFLGISDVGAPLSFGSSRRWRWRCSPGRSTCSRAGGS